MRREALVRFDGGSPGQRPHTSCGDNPGVLSDGKCPERGRQGHAFERRPWRHKAGENPARGVRAETARTTRLAWGPLFSATRQTVQDLEARGPPDEKAAGKSSTMRGANIKRLPVRPH